jgi:hypothetical protein
VKLITEAKAIRNRRWKQWRTVHWKLNKYITSIERQWLDYGIRINTMLIQ